MCDFTNVKASDSTNAFNLSLDLQAVSVRAATVQKRTHKN